MSKKTAIIFIVLSFIALNIISFGFNKFVVKRNRSNSYIEEKTEIDNEAPVLTLKENKFIIYQGVEFNYASFVISAVDNIDGNITDKVEFNKVDLSNVGTYEIEYSVRDNAGNKTSEILELIVKEDIGLQNE